VDVTGQLHRKLGALAQHRTQYPVVPSMLPDSLLQKMLGTEFFRRPVGGGAHAAVRRCAKAPLRRRPPGRPSPRDRDGGVADARAWRRWAGCPRS
jgi:hypothetical protein